MTLTGYIPNSPHRARSRIVAKSAVEVSDHGIATVIRTGLMSNGIGMMSYWC